MIDHRKLEDSNFRCKQFRNCTYRVVCKPFNDGSLDSYLNFLSMYAYTVLFHPIQASYMHNSKLEITIYSVTSEKFNLNPNTSHLEFRIMKF